MITASQIEEIKKTIGITALLLFFNFSDEKFFFNNSNDDLIIDNQKYISMPFEIEEFEMQQGINVDSIELRFDNVSLFPASVFLNKDRRGEKCEVGIAIFDKYGKQLGVVPIWHGFITEVNISEKIARIRISHEFVFWRKNTLRKYNYDDFPNLKDLDEKEIWWGRKPK